MIDKQTVNLAELTALVAEATGLKEKDARKAITATLYTIQQEVAAGHRVVIANFGRWEAVLRAGRTARNPKTGEEIAVPTTWKPRFTPGAGFAGLVAEKRAAAN